MLYKKTKVTKGEQKHTNIQGDDAMGNSVMPYVALDLHFLDKKNVKVVSSDNALESVNPVPWGEDVLQGREKITVVKKKNGE